MISEVESISVLNDPKYRIKNFFEIPLSGMMDYGDMLTAFCVV